MTDTQSEQLSLLLVDDESDLLEVYEDVLSKTNIKIYKANNGLEALALVKNGIPGAVFTDLNMPEMGGLDFIRKVRQELKLWIPIVIISAHGEKNSAVEALRLGVYDFLEKPVNFKNFLALAEKLARFGTNLKIRLDTARTPEERELIYYTEMAKQKIG